MRDIWGSAVDACRVSAMLFMILAGASVFGHVLTKLRIPQQIVEAIIAADIGVTGFLIVMMALIFVLGMFLESIAIILITPPVGMNLFTIKAITRAPIGEIVRGSAPYVLLMIAVLAVVMIWPQLALWLLGTMFAR